jgi:thiol-disulfide isomerase/thioredoxin
MKYVETGHRRAFQISRLAFAAGLVLLIAGEGHAGEMRNVNGCVVDENGTPVAHADVAFFWTANGPLNDPSGKPYDFDTVEGRRVLSANLGKMFPLGDIERPTKTGPDGRFSISIPGDRHHLLAMDHSRNRGGLVILPKGKGAADVQIRLGPMVRVRGSIEGPGAGERPTEPTVLALLPDDPARPLDLTILTRCTAIDSRFEMSLPPGHYVLNISASRDNFNEEANAPNRELLLTGEISEIDLGVLRLSPFKPTIRGRIERAKAVGTWGDYTKHYGEKPPQWHILDARGVSKDAQISDFKGKWLLLYFWGLPCNPCISRGIPNLMKFYEEHQAQRDRFEILALYMDVEGEVKSVSDLDKRLQPVVKNVWGKPLPFPVLLDPSFTTMERYGLPGFGTLILIDPQGNLVKGDETVLAEKLKE